MSCSALSADYEGRRRRFSFGQGGFGAVNRLASHIIIGHVKTLEEVEKLADAGLKTPEFKAISITSGVWRSPEEEVERVAGMVKELRKYNVPIGVSVYATGDSSEILKEAGAIVVEHFHEIAHLVKEIL